MLFCIVGEGERLVTELAQLIDVYDTYTVHKISSIGNYEYCYFKFQNWSGDAKVIISGGDGFSL